MAVEIKNQQLDTKTIEVQLFAGAQNTRPQGGLPTDTDTNPKQVNMVCTRSSLELEKLEPKMMT